MNPGLTAKLLQKAFNGEPCLGYIYAAQVALESQLPFCSLDFIESWGLHQSVFKTNPSFSLFCIMKIKQEC
jgi:hypothetical protein